MSPSVDGVVDGVMDEVHRVRRSIHENPELSGEEFATTELLQTVLSANGLRPRTRTPKTGLTVDIGDQGPLVAFRADIDALPIQEPSGHDPISKVPGVMHACGHDAHAAIALGIALAANRMDLPGRLRVVFQPAEETFPGGAFELIEERVLDGVSAIFAFHVDPSLATGKVGLRPGEITSSADRFYITLEGPGGHTARPHQTVDLIAAAGEVASRLHAVMQRRIDARSPIAVVFGQIRGGSADNIIPTEVEMSGTVRTADRSLWDSTSKLLTEAVHTIVEPYGAAATVHYQRGLPPVVNHIGQVAMLRRVLTTSLGADAVVETHVSMGAEDFSRYLDRAPGALIRLGCREGDADSDLHSTSFHLDEKSLAVGVRAGLAAVLGALEAAAITPRQEADPEDRD